MGNTPQIHDKETPHELPQTRRRHAAEQSPFLFADSKPQAARIPIGNVHASLPNKRLLRSVGTLIASSLNKTGKGLDDSAFLTKPSRRQIDRRESGAY